MAQKLLGQEIYGTEIQGFFVCLAQKLEGMAHILIENHLFWMENRLKSNKLQQNGHKIALFGTNIG